MGLFLVIALISWGITKSIHDGRVDHTYAKQGLVSPRLEAKYGGKQKAADATARYGFGDYMKDAWSDHWQAAAQVRAADRQVRTEARVAAPKGRVSWRERWTAAKDGMARAGRVLVEPVGGDKPTVPSEPVPVMPLVESGDVPVGTVRHTDGGREQWDGTVWSATADPEEDTVNEDDDRLPVCEGCGRPIVPGTGKRGLCMGCAALADGHPEGRSGWLAMKRRHREARERLANASPEERDRIRREGARRINLNDSDGSADEPTDPEPATPATTEGTTMSAPTGEAVNYETTISELNALAREQRTHLDSCMSALKQIESAKSSINDMQESYRASAASAASMSEHLSALNLDGVTLGNAGTTADAMPAGVVDQMYDQLEGMEAAAKERLAAAEAALAATEANLAHIQNTYGAAHETVTGNLGGDSRFLDSAGGAGQPGPGVDSRYRAEGAAIRPADGRANVDDTAAQAAAPGGTDRVDATPVRAPEVASQRPQAPPPPRFVRDPLTGEGVFTRPWSDLDR